MWHVGPSSLPVDLAGRLEGRGFEGSADTSMVVGCFGRPGDRPLGFVLIECTISSSGVDNLHPDPGGRPAGVGGEDLIGAEDRGCREDERVGETERSPVPCPERRCLPRYLPRCRLDSCRQGVQKGIDRSDRLITPTTRPDEGFGIGRRRDDERVARLPGLAERLDRRAVVGV